MSTPAVTRAHLESAARGEPLAEDIRRAIGGSEDLRAQVAAIRNDNDLLGELLGAVSEDDALEGADLEPGRDERVGEYRIESELHRGGQGVVYRAYHPPTRRHVALKMLLLGGFATSKQRARFEREVELVAQLRHAGIVTVYDSGVSEGGRHFLAMEFIDGEPLTRWVGPPAPGEPVKKRVRRVFELFEKVCDAVAYAHRRGIIHRDIKPSNILVDAQGEAHVLDFGIAKATEVTGAEDAPEMTRPGEFVGTMLYAAPEQVNAGEEQVDLRADIYAIGMVLYEALCGERAYELRGALSEVVRTITDGQPTRPTRYLPGLDDDAETIVLRCLSKEPERRYQSADALARDLRNYLDDLPIDAKRDTTTYVVRKLAWKHRRELALTGVVLGLVIGIAAVGFVSVTLQAQRTESTLFSIVDPLGMVDMETSDVSVRTIEDYLDLVSDVASEQLAAYPGMLAQVKDPLARAYLNRNAFDRAERELEQVIDLRESLGERDSEAFATNLHNLGRVRWRAGNYSGALVAYERALAMREALFGDEHADTARTLSHLGSTLTQLGRLDEGEAMYRRALRGAATIMGENDPFVANVGNSLSVCLREQGRVEEALETSRESLRIVRAHFGDADWRVGRMLHTIGAYETDLRRFDDAERSLDASLVNKRAFHGEGSVEVARTLKQIAELRALRSRERGVDREDLQRALAELERAHAIQESSYEGAHVDLGETAMTSGRVQLALGAHAEALRSFERAGRTFASAAGADDWRVVLAGAYASIALCARGDVPADRVVEAIATLEARLGGEGQDVSQAKGWAREVLGPETGL